jgi:hypothetical protein
MVVSADTKGADSNTLGAERRGLSDTHLDLRTGGAAVGNARTVVFLAVLTPCVEFLTGSTSVIGVLTNPGTAIAFVVLTLPGYILPVLLIREALVTWHKSGPSLLALGIAYGAVNEGLLAKTYFSVNPLSPVLGPAPGVGRWIGVNWPWVTDITFFHMIVSMSVPVVLAFLLFPETRQTRFLTERTIRWFFGYLLAVILGLLTIQSLFSLAFRGLLPLMLLPASIVLLGVYLSRRLPRPDPSSMLQGRLSRPLPLTLAGMGFFLVVFFPIIQFFPFPFTPLTFASQQFYRLGNAAGVVATIYPILLVALAIRFFTRYSLTETQLAAVTTGVMIMPLATAIAIHDFPQGDLAAAALYIAAIVVAWRRARKRASTDRQAASAP